MERNTFKFFRSYRDSARAIASVSVEDAFSFLMAIMDYALDGAAPDSTGTTAAMFLLVKPTLDASIKRQEAGAKGGSSSKQTSTAEDFDESTEPEPASKPQANASKPQAPVKQTASTNQAPFKQTASTRQAEAKHQESTEQPAETKTDLSVSKPEPEVGSRMKEVGSKDVGCRSKEELLSSKECVSTQAHTHQEPMDSFSPLVSAKLREWFNYKAQRREGYTPQGRQALLSQVAKYLESYPESAVCALIDECMAASWKTIVFERLDKKPAAYTPARDQPKPQRRELDADEQAAIRRMFGGDAP